MEKRTLTPSSENITPFLVARSVRRSDSPVLPGNYNSTTHVWAVDGPMGPKPLIYSESSVSELMTKTAVGPERDDTESMVVLSALTKTAAQLERDDDHYRRPKCAPILELSTKTEAGRERDD